MGSILQEIRESVIQYAQTIEKVTKVDVEIVDENSIKVVDTGVQHHQGRKNTVEDGSLYQAVMSSGKSFFIENPKEHPLCQTCSGRATCNEWAELCTPIILKKKIIGVIGLVCFNKQQQKRIIDNLTTYRDFVLQIADFISAKANEKMEADQASQMTKLLNMVISHLDEGIVILDKESKVRHANEAAMKQLRSEQLDGMKLQIEDTGDMLLNSEEYKLTLADQTFHVIGDLLPVQPELAEYAQILIFNNMKKIKSDIYNLTNLNKQQDVNQIIGEAPQMLELKKQIAKVSKSASTILVTGESGTGKDLVARAIHSESNRKDQPFISINCGAIPDTLLESELFGYVKGAFTGADPRGKIGKFELANKGTIFLDEIGDMPLYLQVKLLRVLQDRRIIRIGSNQVMNVDVRVIAATNRDLRSLIKENKFRRDLYYRLNVIPLHVPALRERKEDIQALVQMLLLKYCRLFNREMVRIDGETMSLLTGYPWPGNVRELENTMEFMINMAEESAPLTKKCLPENILRYYSGERSEEIEDDTIVPLKEIEKRYILKTMAICGSDVDGKQRAAKELGIGIATLYRKLDAYKKE